MRSSPTLTARDGAKSRASRVFWTARRASPTTSSYTNPALDLVSRDLLFEVSFSLPRSSSRFDREEILFVVLVAEGLCYVGALRFVGKFLTVPSPTSIWRLNSLS